MSDLEMSGDLDSDLASSLSFRGPTAADTLPAGIGIDPPLPSVIGLAGAAGSFRSPVEDPWSFTTFMEQLKVFRKTGNDILDSLTPTNNENTKLENYKSCVENLNERQKLLTSYRKEVDKQMKESRKIIDANDGIVKTMEAALEESKLERLEYFIEAIKAESQREEFYKDRAIKVYMAKCLDVKVRKVHGEDIE